MVALKLDLKLTTTSVLVSSCEEMIGLFVLDCVENDVYFGTKFPVALVYIKVLSLTFEVAIFFGTSSDFDDLKLVCEIVLVEAVVPANLFGYWQKEYSIKQITNIK